MSTDFFLLHDIMKKKGSECVCIREREKERERDERERERVTYQNGQFFFFGGRYTRNPIHQYLIHV